MAYHRDLKKHGFKTGNKVYVVAEIGLNHGGDIRTAEKLIESASKTGVDAVKFQTYITEKRAPVNSPIFGVLKKCELPFLAFKGLKEYSLARGVEFFSTPFDEESVDLLESIDCNIYKIASFDVVNHRLLKKVADTKKTVVMSVGMSNLSEIERAFKILKNGSDNIALLHCISAYPAREEDSNLSAIRTLSDKFDCVIGHSDHTNDIQVPLYAVAAGAQIIEKHYKINAAMACVDAPVSISELQMKKLVGEVRRLERIFGNDAVAIREAERPCEIFRRHTTAR